MTPRLATIAMLAAALAPGAMAQERTQLLQAVDQRIERIEPQVIDWRHDIHQHPELGNREVRTAGLVAEELRRLGIETQTGVAHTGVVGLLRGALPGPVVAIRAELDALPLTEPAGLPFASTVRTQYDGQEVGVMHACGHDAHAAMLLGVAAVLSAERARLPGTVKFVFQPAEEGVPQGEEGGAQLMVREGVLANPRPDVFFGLHVGPGKSGSLSVSRDRVTAGSDIFVARIHGRPAHGGMPWLGIDPVTLAAQVILAWQTIPSRQENLSEPGAPVITVGRINGGVRQNILPAEVRLEGTLRTLSAEQRADVLQRLRRTAGSIAESAGGSAEIEVTEGYPAGWNNPQLVDRFLPTLQQVAPDHQVRIGKGSYAADDFAYFSREIPALFIGMGVTPPEIDPAQAAPNHSPDFVVDDKALAVGVRALSHLTVDYLYAQGGAQ